MNRRNLYIILGVIALLLVLAVLLQPIIKPTEPFPSPTPFPTRPETATATRTPVLPGQPTSTSTPFAPLTPPAVTSTPVAGKPPTLAPTGLEFYVSVDGSKDGDGSQARPWDLETALSGQVPIEPGATIWVGGGNYNYRHVDYLFSRVKGTPEKPVTIRAYPGEDPIIDAAISIYGEWTTFWGLDLIDANQDRTSQYVRKAGLSIWAPGVKIINSIIRDSGGFGFWWQSTSSELYGNLVYNNGFIGPDRGHGHGIYTTNQTGAKLIEENIVFNNFSGINVHAYSEKTYLDGFRFEGNVSFNGEFLVGGYVPASHVEIINNFFYRSPVRLGYGPGLDNKGLEISGNYFYSTDASSLKIRDWSEIQASQNIAWEGGTKVDSPTLQEGSSYTIQPRSGQEVFVRPNKYEAGRANVIIYNWDKQDTVRVDISKVGLKPGDAYVLHNAQDYFTSPIRGVYDGSPITVPMTGWKIVNPTGWHKPLRSSTFPEFGVFILIKAAK